MNLNINYVDALAAAGHRRELEEQARAERLLAEVYTYSHPTPKHFSLTWLLRWRRHTEQPAEESLRHS
ncbi:MAG: hypothetical protein WCJ55_18160 [Chloroflexales bacterium]